MTKKIITGVAFALATVLASPAFAQSGPMNQRDAYHAYGQSEFGPPQVTTNGFRNSAREPWNVYDTYGRYVGRDPDPNVREMIARDRAEQFNSGY